MPREDVNLLVQISEELHYFYGANLRSAHLQTADLTNANFEGANLEGANLKGAKLNNANLKGANLQRAYLRHVNLQNTMQSLTVPICLEQFDRTLKRLNVQKVEWEHCYEAMRREFVDLFSGENSINEDCRYN
uniref:Pentapeptide repeat-containing protein n=1 Tax=Salix viminalis TaxID=40686 RepID=A0A6N2NK69_SALVM